MVRLDGKAVVPRAVADEIRDEPAASALDAAVSGSIGVLVAAVEHGNLSPDDAKDALVAMDETGARSSASLMRRAEGVIDDATGEP